VTAQSRIDPATGATLTLAPEGLTMLRRDGRQSFIPAPDGFSLSHFEGAAVVGRGEAAIDGWWDWHFEVDAEAGRLRRLGPAY